MPELNHFAVWAAVIATQVIGFVWYMPQTFGRVWIRGYRMSEAELGNPHPSAWIIMVGGTIAYSYTIAGIMRALDVVGAGPGLLFALVIWLGVIVPRLWMHMSFGKIGFRAMVVDAGMELAATVATVLILGIWLP